MKVTSCKSSGMEVSPAAYNACTFQIIDKWNPDQHAKTCDTMFYLSDGTGAYVWDCDRWKFLDFTGVTQSDWKAKQNEAGYIKNKPFKTLGNGLSVDDNGVLFVTVKGNVKSDWNAANDSDAEILNKPFKTLGKNLGVDENGVLNVNAIVDIKDSNGKSLPQEEGVVTLPESSASSTAEKLSTARDLKVDLTSKLAQSFDGSADATTIGVTGTLPLANGGTGNTDGQSRGIKTVNSTDGDDLNNYITNGNWYTGNIKVLNTPDADSMYYTVEVVSNNNSLIQRVTDVVHNRLFIRTRSGNPLKWSDWVEITNQNNSTNIPLTNGTINTNAKNAVLKYRIINDVIYISGSIDVVASDSNGESIKVGNIPEQYQPKKLINGVGKVHLNVGLFSKGFENAQVVVVGDENAAAKGAVMFSVQSTAKLTAGTWTFFGSYNLI